MCTHKHNDIFFNLFTLNTRLSVLTTASSHTVSPSLTELPSFVYTETFPTALVPECSKMLASTHFYFVLLQKRYFMARSVWCV